MILFPPPGYSSKIDHLCSEEEIKSYTLLGNAPLNVTPEDHKKWVLTRKQRKQENKVES